MERQSRAQRAIVYCIVPDDLAARLHEPLRRHFHDDPTVEVVVEQRRGDRRSIDRRAAQSDVVADERRRIRAASGRRVADRRDAVAAPLDVELPRKARPFADRLVFIERLEPSTQELEDRATAQMVTRFQAGDRDVFAELYVRYFDRVYRYLLIILAAPDAAEDATQQTFMQVLAALPDYEQRRAPFRGWLFVIARNCAFTELRKRSRVDVTDSIELWEGEDNSGDEGNDMPVLDWISDRELLLFIDRLPISQRQVLFLRYTLDLPYPEIARILDRSPDDVRMLHHRAMTFLRERLGALRRGAEQGRPQGMVRVRAQSFLLRRRRYALMR